jgi:hypothetical protein
MTTRAGKFRAQFSVRIDRLAGHAEASGQKTSLSFGHFCVVAQGRVCGDPFDFMRLKRMPAMWTGDLIQERRGSGFTHGGDESFLNYDAR